MIDWTIRPIHPSKTARRDARAAEMARALLDANGGPILRVQRACNVWCDVLPNGPRLSYATLRAMRRRKLLTRLREPDLTGRETYMLTGDE